MAMSSDVEKACDVTVVCQLGGGSFGSRVYGCRDAVTRQPVAVKAYDREASAGRSQRVLAEKAVMQRLTAHGCPHMTHLLRTAKDDRCLYFVMDAHLGGHLQQHIASARGGQLPLPVVRGYAAELVSALLHLAGRGCIHRDVKSRNVLVDGAGRLKLCDFGLSKAFSDGDGDGDGDGDDARRAHSFVGTPPYMAPEVMAKVEGGYSMSVDWFSLGVLLFEMRCGDFPALEQRALPRPPAAATAPSSSTADAWPDDATRDAARAAVTADPNDGGRVSAAPRPWALTAASDAALSRPPPQPQQPSDNAVSNFRDLVLALLEPCPAARLGPGRRQDLLAHPFFAPVDWPAVDAGAAPVADPDFNRTPGFLDLFDTGEGPQPADDAAFADF